MKKIENYQESFKGLQEGEQYIDNIMDIDVSFIIEMGGIGFKDLIEEKINLVKKQKEEMDKQSLSKDYKNGFLVGMKNSMQKKIKESEGEDREIMEEIADLLLEPFVDYTNLEKIEIPNGMTDISLSAVEGETGFSSENLNVNGIVIPEKLQIVRSTSSDKMNQKNVGLSNEMREKIDEAVKLMETGLSREAISFMVGLSKYDVEQIYKIYHPEQKEEARLTTNKTFK